MRHAIVEFCGVPGGGKSTTIHRLQTYNPEAVECITLNMYSKFNEFRCAASFALRHPVSFFWIVLFVGQYHMKGLFLYSLHLALRACGKYGGAESYGGNKNIVIDEGLIHILSTIPAASVPQEKMERWISRIILPSAVCIALEGTFHRFHRLDTSVHPRIQKGEDALYAWEEAVRVNVQTVHTCLKKKCVSVWYIPSNIKYDASESLNQYILRI